MEVLLLGTGSADGWPNPFCSCSSCATAVAAATIRGQTSVLVDGVLMLDCGPEAPRAALRAGHSLAAVRHLLLTHAHHDHVGPAALVMRHWAGRREDLDVIGPVAALQQCHDWVGPDDPVLFHPVVAGDDVRLGDYQIRVLAAEHGNDGSGDAVLYDVTAPDGQRLLYATDTGPLPWTTVDAVRGAAYDVVLLEETFGDDLDHGSEHLDLSTFPRALADLRDVGAITDRTDVVAVHLGHRNPPDLDERLARWGARAVADGTVLDPHARRMRPAPRRTLVLGGARSGKSAHAERALLERDDVVYVATGGSRDDDPEWAERVEQHRARRPATWTTVETTDVAGQLLGAGPGRPVLVDCLALWTTAVLDDGGWDGTWCDDLVDMRLAELVSALRSTPADVVLVSNEVGQGVVPATASGRTFRDVLGRVNVAVARECDEVVLMTAGLPTTVKQPKETETA